MVLLKKASNPKKEITKILYDQGFILSYKFMETTNKQGKIKIALKYDIQTWKLVLANVFHYGQAVFEGMKAYKDDSAIS